MPLRSKRAHSSPLRIVSLAPNATSILFAIGAQKNLVGVSKWCKDVAPVGHLPRVGDCWALDVESVRKLHPSLLIGSVPFKAEVVSALLDLPCNFLALNPRNLADIERDIKAVGGITNRAAAAQKLVYTMRKAFARLSARSVDGFHRTPEVYCEAWPNPRISSPPWVAELVEMLGGKFALPAGQRVSDAQVARAAPDVIVLAWAATGDRGEAKRVYNNPAWKNIPAVINQRVFVISDELLNTPGPPLINGAKLLFKAIHSTLQIT